jgi:hypothetical protein
MIRAYRFATVIPDVDPSISIPNTHLELEKMTHSHEQKQVQELK